jgi:PAS domain S-box-containing protein
MTDGQSALDRTRRQLQDSEIRLQQVLDNTSAAVFAKDAHGRYLFVNRAFEQLARRDVSQIIGRTDEQVFLPEVAARFRHNDLCVLREQRAIEFEELCDFGDGPQVYLSSKFPLFDAEGVAYAVCGVATDITERKRLEEALSSAALAVSQTEGEALFREYARYLATILRADAAFISTVESANATQMGVRAMYLDDRIVENFSYSLTGTPCATVVGQQFRYYPTRLTELFPADSAFREAGFDCYAGQPLSDSAGRQVGLIAVVARKRLENPAFIESVLRIFAVRVVAELERVAARNALRASEASYREIFEASEDAIFVHDWDTGAIVDANTQASITYGYGREELLHARLADLSSGEPPYTDAEGLAWIEAAKRDGSARFEWHRRSKDGSLHWDEVRLKAARIGGTPRVLAFTREITERKEAEQALRASEEQYRTVFNASADALVLWNSRSERVDVNPAYERMYGYSREEVLAGKRARELPEEHRRVQASIIARTLAGESCSGEIETVRRGGEAFPIEVRTVPIQHRGEPHVLAMIRDLTERRRGEEEHARLESRLRQAQKMEALGQLTGGIAHDFNNLLTSILGYVTLAGERDAAMSDPRLSGYLAQAKRSCERARDLIQQMLMASRGHRGTPRIVSLATQARQALEAVRPMLGEGVVLEHGLDDAVPPVSVDPLQFEQVLLNLCINARDALEGPGRVRVAVRPARIGGIACTSCRSVIDGEFVELCVEDTGHGIAPELVERIFEPFFSTKETGKGTGMGLAMVHGLVHEHGGHVVVESEPGCGSRVRVLWPAVAAELPAAASTPTGAGFAQRARRPSLEGRVLVVDDEVPVGEYMRELLESWGLHVTFAPGPHAALELLEQAPVPFDAMITDQAMPRMTGLQVARTLRGLGRDLPVLIYSGYSDGIDRADLDAAGVSAVLRKPVDPAALEAALQAVL